MKFWHFSRSPQSMSTRSVIPQSGPYRERWSVYRTSDLFIHSYLSESPVKELFHESVWKRISSLRESHADGRHGSPEESFTALLLLPQHCSAFGMILCIFSLVDQGSIVTSARCLLNTCYHHPHDTRYGSPHNAEVWLRSRIHGRMSNVAYTDMYLTLSVLQPLAKCPSKRYMQNVANVLKEGNCVMLLFRARTEDI
jgi:hypothetical protein